MGFLGNTDKNKQILLIIVVQFLCRARISGNKWKHENPSASFVYTPDNKTQIVVINKTKERN